MNVLRLSSPLGADLAFLGTSLKLLMSFIKIDIYLDKIKQEGGREKDFFEKFQLLLYFIEYSAHFFTLKMMLKYSLRTIHGR